MLIAWFLLGAVTVVALGWLLPSNDDSVAEAIIKRRYARGEIDRETFERMLDDVYRNPHDFHDREPPAHRPHAPDLTHR